MRTCVYGIVFKYSQKVKLNSNKNIFKYRS